MQATVEHSENGAEPHARASFEASLPAAQAQWDARAAEACDCACAAIAPAWPLDRSIAVNPHWGRIGRPVREVAARMALLACIRVFPPRGEMLRAWQDGRVTAADLDQALRRLPAAQEAGLSAEGCLRALGEDAFPQRLPLLIEAIVITARGAFVVGELRVRREHVAIPLARQPQAEIEVVVRDCQALVHTADFEITVAPYCGACGDQCGDVLRR